VQKLNQRNRRDRPEARNELRAELDPLAPLSVNAQMIAILEAFPDDRTRSFFPVINARNEPVGIVHEERLKGLLYSQFGRDLLTNRVRPHRETEYLTPCLIFDLTTEIDRVLAAIAQRPNDHAVLVVENGAYIGLHDTRGIIRTMHERMLTIARDQNPLTKLPGNLMVANYMVDALESDQRPQVFVHFDFDNFKPFNDRFGFRQGDRAIAMFADLMRSRLAAGDVFWGHIGGDHFFLGAHGGGGGAGHRLAAALQRAVRVGHGEFLRPRGAAQRYDRGDRPQRHRAIRILAFGQLRLRDRRRNQRTREPRRALRHAGRPQEACETLGREHRDRRLHELVALLPGRAEGASVAGRRPITMQLQPYLSFSGQCEEALDFYRSVFGGEIVGINRYGGSQMEGDVPPDWGDKVMHATFIAGDITIMAADSCQEQPGANNARARLCVGSEVHDDGQRVFDGLAAGGSVTVPYAKQFWGSSFGMLVDRFGIEWMVNAGG